MITRHGRPVVELKPIASPPRSVSAADLDWLAERRIGRASASENAGVPLSKLRDEQER